MNYVTHADLGGRPGFGPVVAEAGEPVFHADWEARALALTLAMGATGAWNIDMSRAARETLADYPRLGYYQVWLAALERLLAERGLVGADELAACRVLRPPRPLPRRLQAADVPGVLARGTATQRPASQPARFAPGDRVRARSGRPDHHTRLPGYAQGRLGVIERVHGMHVFADAHARGLGEQPQWLYAVAFAGQALWGAEAAPGSSVVLDAWESYLEPAP